MICLYQRLIGIGTSLEAGLLDYKAHIIRLT
jgi:hypothetical protein